MNLFALTENSTSRSLSPDSLIRYLENRYLALYEEV
jgi:hypothetical protein